MQPTDTIFFKHKLSRNVFFEEKYPFEAWMMVNNELQCVWRKNAKVIYKFLAVAISNGRPTFVFLRRTLNETSTLNVYNATYEIVVIELAHDSYAIKQVYSYRTRTENLKEYVDNYLEARVIPTEPYSMAQPAKYYPEMIPTYSSTSIACVIDKRADKSKLTTNGDNCFGVASAWNIFSIRSTSDLPNNYFFIQCGYIATSSSNNLNLCSFDTFDDLEFIACMPGPFYLYSLGVSKVTSYNGEVTHDLNSHFVIITPAMTNSVPTVFASEWANNVDFKTTVGSKCLISCKETRESTYIYRRDCIFLGKNSSGEVHQYKISWTRYTSGGTNTYKDYLQRMRFADMGAAGYKSFISDAPHFGYLQSADGTLTKLEGNTGEVIGTVSGSTELTENLKYMYGNDEFGSADFGNTKDILKTINTSDLSSLTEDEYNALDEEDEGVLLFSGAIMHDTYLAVAGDSYSRTKPHIGTSTNGGNIDWKDAYIWSDYFTKIDTNLNDDTQLGVSVSFENCVVNGGTIITGSKGYISTDYGTTWSVVDAGANAGYSGIGILPITYGNGIYIFTALNATPDGGSESSDKVFISSDGVNWTAHDPVLSYEYGRLPSAENIRFINGYFISVYSTIWRSTDGIHWTRQSWNTSSDGVFPSIGCILNDGVSFLSSSITVPSSGNPYIPKYTVSSSGVISLSGRITISDSYVRDKDSLNVSGIANNWTIFNDRPTRISGYYIDDDGALRAQNGIGICLQSPDVSRSNGSYKFCTFNDKLFIVNTASNNNIIYSDDGIEFDSIYTKAVATPYPTSSYDKIIFTTGDKLIVLVVTTYYSSYVSMYKFELNSTENL